MDALSGQRRAADTHSNGQTSFEGLLEVRRTYRPGMVLVGCYGVRYTVHAVLGDWVELRMIGSRVVKRWKAEELDRTTEVEA